LIFGSHYKSLALGPLKQYSLAAWFNIGDSRKLCGPTLQKKKQKKKFTKKPQQKNLPSILFFEKNGFSKF
jgi:hypothetical protein